jgi:hypothetical protein
VCKKSTRIIVNFRLRNNDKFPDKKFETLELAQNLSFLCRAKYKLYRFDNLQCHRICYYKHLGFFAEFFETSKWQILQKFKNGLHEPRPPNRFSDEHWLLISNERVTFLMLQALLISNGHLINQYFQLQHPQCALSMEVHNAPSYISPTVPSPSCSTRRKIFVD